MGVDQWWRLLTDRLLATVALLGTETCAKLSTSESEDGPSSEQAIQLRLVTLMARCPLQRKQA